MFNNVHGLYIVLISFFIGVIPNRKEWIGVLLALCGCFCMALDPKAARVTDLDEAGQSRMNLLPPMVDLASAFFGALYFLLSASNVKKVPICLLLVIMNVHNFIINSSIAKYQSSDIMIFSLSPTHGCLGFLSTQNPLLPMLSWIVMASFFGSAGYVLSLMFYSPLVTSNAFLLEPFVA